MHLLKLFAAPLVVVVALPLEQKAGRRLSSGLEGDASILPWNYPTDYESGLSNSNEQDPGRVEAQAAIGGSRRFRDAWRSVANKSLRARTTPPPEETPEETLKQVSNGQRKRRPKTPEERAVLSKIMSDFKQKQTPEEKAEMERKRLETLAKKTVEEKTKTKERKAEAYERKSPEEREAIRAKRQAKYDLKSAEELAEIARKKAEAYKRKTPEQLAEISQRRVRQTKLNMTPERKAAEERRHQESRDKSPKEKAEIAEKKRQTRKKNREVKAAEIAEKKRQTRKKNREMKEAAWKGLEADQGEESVRKEEASEMPARTGPFYKGLDEWRSKQILPERNAGSTYGAWIAPLSAALRPVWETMGTRLPSMVNLMASQPAF